VRKQMLGTSDGCEHDMVITLKFTLTLFLVQRMTPGPGAAAVLHPVANCPHLHVVLRVYNAHVSAAGERERQREPRRAPAPGLAACTLHTLAMKQVLLVMKQVLLHHQVADDDDEAGRC
jgi:hypothetical protein